MPGQWQKRLDELKKEVDTLQARLSDQATQAYGTLLVNFNAKKDQVNAERNAARDFLSADFLLSLQIDAQLSALTKETKSFARQSEEKESFALLQQAMDCVSKLVADAALFRELKTLLIKGIKNSLNNYYRKQKEHQFIVVKNKPKGLLDDDPYISAETKSFAASGMSAKDAIEKLIAAAKIKSVLDEKIVTADSAQLVFSPELEAMSLQQLLDVATQMLWKTDDNRAMELLHKQAVGNKTFYDYIRSERWKSRGNYLYVTCVPKQNDLLNEETCIKRHEAVIASLRNAIERRSTPVKEKAEEKRMSTAMVDFEKRVGKFAEDTTRKLKEEADKNRKAVENINAQLSAAAEKVSQLERESKAIASTTTSLNGVLSCFKNLSGREYVKKATVQGAVIQNLQETFDRQCKALTTAKGSAEIAMKAIAGIFVADEKVADSVYCREYLRVRDNYAKIIAPTYEAAIAQASKLLDRTVVNQKINDYNTTLRQAIAELKEKREAKLREREQAASPALQELMPRLNGTLQKAQTAYNNAEKLLGSIRETKVIVDNTCEDAKQSPEAKFHNVQACIRSLKVDEKKYQLARRDAATHLQALRSNEEKLDSDVKASKNYALFQKNRAALEEKYTKHCVCMPDCPGLVRQITEKADQLAVAVKAEAKRNENELIDRAFKFFQVLFNDENIIDFWSQQVSFLGSMRAHLDGARVRVEKKDGSEAMLSMPRGAYGARKELDDSKNEKNTDKKTIVANICKRIKSRMNGGCCTRKKPTSIVYSAIVDLLDEHDNLAINQHNLDELTRVLQRNPEMLIGLQLEKNSIERNVAVFAPV